MVSALTGELVEVRGKVLIEWLCEEVAGVADIVVSLCKEDGTKMLSFPMQLYKGGSSTLQIGSWSVEYQLSSAFLPK